MALAMVALTACAAFHAPTSDAPIAWLPLKADLNAPPSPSPQPIPVPSGTPACTADQLVGGVIGSQGATGHVITSFAFATSSSAPCFLEGTPLVRLLDASGKPLAFQQHASYMPPIVIGPVLVDPGGKPEAPQGLKAGEAGLSIDWVSQPEACLGQSGTVIAGARIELQGGGAVSIPLPSEPAGYQCQGVGVSSFEGVAMPVNVIPPPPLPSVTVTAPASAKAGKRFEYIVTLTNDGQATMNLVANCPNYEEELIEPGGIPLGGKHFYKLNCTPAGKLAPERSAKFQMVFDVPATAAPGDYSLVFMLGYWNAMTKFTAPYAVNITV